MLVTRTLNLAVYGNTSKTEAARYTCQNFNKYLHHFLTQLFFYPGKFLSTAGMGKLANQAQHKARAILRAQRQAAKVTDDKTNIPQIKSTFCPAKIEISKDSSFDYWVNFEDPFSKKRIRIPVKSHKRLNHFLRDGYDLNSVGELALQKNGRWQFRCFVQKEVSKAIPRDQSLGVDVGMTHLVSRSDGYLGISAVNILKSARDKNVERYRQGHHRTIPKSSFKQQLNIEARRAVNVSQRNGWNLIVESPKVLANLRSKLQWARSYFAHRVRVLGEEMGVFVWDQNPAYTSRTCSCCWHRDGESRVKSVFQCTACGNRTHADINAARVIAYEGTETIRLRFNPVRRHGFQPRNTCLVKSIPS